MALTDAGVDFFRMGKMSLVAAAILAATAYFAFRTVNRRAQRTVEMLLSDPSEKPSIGFGGGI